jgi:NAD(P)H-dependent flavin oxidoreductase YrpB (nitropropane dioxygenase family)
VAAEFATPFTRLVGCRAPIQLAVMGGGTGTPELAAAVSQAGGLGMLSSTFPMSVDEQLSWVQERTERPVGVGFFAFDLPARTGELELAGRRARVVDVFGALELGRDLLVRAGDGMGQVPGPLVWLIRVGGRGEADLNLLALGKGRPVVHRRADQRMAEAVIERRWLGVEAGPRRAVAAMKITLIKVE